MTAVRRTGDGMGPKFVSGTGEPPEKPRQGGSGTMRRFEQAFADESPSTAASSLRAVIANAPVIFCAIDRMGVITLSEGRGLTPLGVAPGELVGRSAFDVYAALQIVGVDQRVTPLPEAIRLVLGGASMAGLCSVGDFLFELRLVPQTRESTGEADGAVGVWTDITERDQARAQLLQSDRLAALGTLAAGTAHEINNPLTYTVLNCEHVLRELRALAAGQGKLTADQLQDMIVSLSRSVDGAMQVRRIVRQLMLFACGGDVDSRTPVDVRGVVESAIQMALHEIVFRARLVRNLAPVPTVKANETSLGQVFLNLLVNAAQSIPEGKPDEHEVRVSTSVDESGRIVVEVSDTGCGIEPAQLPRVFDPFFTMKAGGVAMGLGLSLSHGTITGLGGQITVASTPGIGSTFRVVLPPRNAAPMPGDEEGATARGERRARILVVDDEPRVREALGRALGRDFIVTLAGSGQEALDMLSDPARGLYDVILCDLMMQDMSGMDLYAETLRSRPAAGGRFVFMTGGAFTPNARAFLENVDRPCLEKPLDVGKLREIVRTSRAAVA